MQAYVGLWIKDKRDKKNEDNLGQAFNYSFNNYGYI